MAFHRWADLARPPSEKMRAAALEHERCWAYMVEPAAGYVVQHQVHRSEQVVQVLSGTLHLEIEGHGARDLGPDDVAVIPPGHHHHGVVPVASRIFELNAPRDVENLYERRDEWPAPAATLRGEDGAELGPFVRWPDLGERRPKALGSLLEVVRASVPAGSDVSGATRGGFFQVLSGGLLFEVNGEEAELTPDWVATMEPGDEWRVRAAEPTELLEVFFR